METGILTALIGIYTLLHAQQWAEKWVGPSTSSTTAKPSAPYDPGAKPNTPGAGTGGGGGGAW